MDSLDFSGQATPVKLPDFSASATPVEHAPDFSDQATRVDDAPLTLSSKPLAAGVDLGALLPNAVVAVAPSGPDASSLAVPGRQFVGGLGDVLQEARDFVQKQGQQKLGNDLSQALPIQAATTLASAAHAVAGGKPSALPSEQDRVLGTAARFAPQLLPLAAAPEGGVPAAEELVPALGKLAESNPRVAKMLSAVLDAPLRAAGATPKAATTTALQETQNPNATNDDYLKNLALNAAAFGAPASVSTSQGLNALLGAGTGAGINELLARANGQAPGLDSDMAMALTGALGGAGHVPEAHAVPEPVAAPAARAEPASVPADDAELEALAAQAVQAKQGASGAPPPEPTPVVATEPASVPAVPSPLPEAAPAAPVAESAPSEAAAPASGDLDALEGAMQRAGVEPDKIAQVRQAMQVHATETPAEASTPPDDATPIAPVAQNAATPTPTLAGTSPPERPSTLDFGNRSDAELDAEYAALPGTDGGRLLDTDTVRELSPDYRADRSRSQEVHGAASAFIKARYQRMLDAPVAPGREARVDFLAGGAGSGKSTAARDLLGRSDADITYDGTLSNYARAKSEIDAALASGRDVRVIYVSQNLETAAKLAIQRAIDHGRTVPAEHFATGHALAPEVIRQLQQEYNGTHGVRFEAIDNRGPKGSAKLTSIEDIPDVNRTNAEAVYRQEAERARAEGRLNEKLYRAIRGRNSSAALEGTGANRQVDDDTGGNRGSSSERPAAGGQPQPQRAGERRDAVSEEPPAAPSTGIKNAQVAAEREARGLDEIDYDGKRKFGDVWETARAKLAEDPDYGQHLAQSVITHPRPLKAEETAALIQDRMRIGNQRRAAARELNAANDAGDPIAHTIAQNKLRTAEEAMELSDQASRASGYEQGLGLAMRRAMAREDYSLDAMEARYQAKKGSALTPSELQRIEELHKELQAKEDQITALQAKLANRRAVPKREAKTSEERFHALAAKLKAMRDDEQMVCAT